MSESLSEIGKRGAVFYAAVEWRAARMDMAFANMKQDNRARLDRLSNAEDALSKAVLAAALPSPLIAIQAETTGK